MNLHTKYVINIRTSNRTDRIAAVVIHLFTAYAYKNAISWKPKKLTNCCDTGVVCTMPVETKLNAAYSSGYCRADVHAECCERDSYDVCTA